MINIYNKLTNRKVQILGIEEFAKFAVLLPIVEKNNEPHILFEVRSRQLRHQPGEICFPGGKKEPFDKNAIETAVRETSEELGIPASSIKDIVPLDYLVTPYGKIIYPFAGVIVDHDKIKPNPDEVEEVFLVPLSYLQKAEPEIYEVHCKMVPEKNFPFQHIIGGENYRWSARSIKEHFYFYEDKVIWGLTARILAHFLDLLRRNDEDAGKNPNIQKNDFQS